MRGRDLRQLRHGEQPGTEVLPGVRNTPPRDVPELRSPTRRGITFWALGEMVRSRANLVEGDDEATSRRKLTAAVGEWVPDESERDWVLDGLLGLLGIESPRGSREQLFAAWRTFFERIAQRGPVMLV